MANLADGPYVLSVSADDAAENHADFTVPFAVDTTPPAVAFSSPTAGVVLRRTTAPVTVLGFVTDTNLQEYASASAPVRSRRRLSTSRTARPGAALGLGSWSVAFLSDGDYTLRLLATDRAGYTAEARRMVTLDATPPVAQIDIPAEDGFVGGAPIVSGTASDANLESWTLEAAGGHDAAGLEWLPVGAGSSSVASGPLVTWSPLPSDGAYTLRLTVLDRAGLSATGHRNVIVDTMPPSSPSGLTATVRANGPHGDVTLSWTANTEPDLAGYRLSRESQEITPGVLVAPGYLDAGRPEGDIRYSVVAVDRAGNASKPATITVRVDATPPVADILAPFAGAAVSGDVDIRGTAFSPGDFKEYRLLIGVGAAPTTFTILTRSGIGVRAGRLRDMDRLRRRPLRPGPRGRGHDRKRGPRLRTARGGHPGAGLARAR